MNHKTCLVVLLAVVPALAQESGTAQSERPAGPPGGPTVSGPRGRREFGPGDRRFDFPRTPVLFRLFDTNSDGVLDEKEINAAPNVLRKLDRNGDGKSSRVNCSRR